MKKIFLTGALALSLTLGACDDYLDINESPNSPAQSNLTPDLIFPGAEMALCNSLSDFLGITGGYFAQYYAQTFGTSNYLDYSQFQMSAVRSGSTYTNLCTRALQNLSTVMSMAKQDEDWGTYLACTVYKAVTYQVFVDCYGEIPYSEGLDINNISPKYDDGKDIYAGILAELDEALGKVTGMETVCKNFLFPGSRASEWIKLANSVKLRILMRESDVVDVKSQLSALVADDNFITEDVAWTGCWKNESGQANPFYQEEFATYFGSTQQNVILNLSLLSAMNAADDARLSAFFNPNTDKKEFTGGISGTNFSTTASYKATYWCRPNMAYDSPVYLITKAEVEFFLAEYEARYGSASTAEDHYKAAIAASFATAGVSGEDTVLEAYPWDTANWKKNLGIQKWVALAGTGTFEGWCELRRLKYPEIGTVTGTDLYNVVTDVYTPSLLTPGTLYTPIDPSGDLGPGKILQRWPYPESSYNRNMNKPDAKEVSVPVFWAN